MNPSLHSLQEIEKRAKDASVRFLMTEIETASSLLARIAESPDPKEKAAYLREARAIVALAARIARTEPLSVSHEAEIRNRLQALRDRLDQLSDQLSAIYPQSPLLGMR